jgi:hypothetical protein
MPGKGKADTSLKGPGKKQHHLKMGKKAIEGKENQG